MIKNLCIKCPPEIKGKCCHFSYEAYTDDEFKPKMYNVIFKNQKCPFYNETKKCCIVYPHRFEVNPYCISSLDGAENGGLIEGCAYLKKHKKHIKIQPKIMDIPDDVRIIDKKMMEYLDNLPSEQFLQFFYPKLLFGFNLIKEEEEELKIKIDNDLLDRIRMKQFKPINKKETRDLSILELKKNLDNNKHLI